MNKKCFIIKIICLFFSIFMLVSSFVSCADAVKDPIVEYEDSAISLAMYEFMLSRIKGTLARNKNDVNPTSEFWNEKRGGTELSNEEYYNNVTLDNCKNYLAALVIFEEEGLRLSNSTLYNIEEEIEFYIDYDCGGSEEKLDALLSKYGVDTDGLRAVYETEAKYQAVIAHLYGESGSQISDSVKEEYYKKNYYRFKQILISNFYYEYVKDDEGNEIYFDPSDSKKPLYDTAGEYGHDENENRLKDKYGVVIRFDEDGKILYDMKNGVRVPVTDENGDAIKYMYSDEQMAKRTEEAKEIAEKTKGNYSAFEAEMKERQLYDGAGEIYADGYYLSDIESLGYTENMFDILDALKEMDESDTRVIEGGNGYHIVMKYELDKGKFSDSDYTEWFASFNDSLITKLFIDRCERFYSKITVNQDNFIKAKSIKSIGTNFDY